MTPSKVSFSRASVKVAYAGVSVRPNLKLKKRCTSASNRVGHVFGSFKNRINDGDQFNPAIGENVR